MKKYSWLDGTPAAWDQQRKHHKGGGGSTSTTTASIAPEFKPLLDLYTKQATQIAQTPWQGYGGQRFADLTGTQNLGIGMVQDRALNGSQTFNNAEGNLNQMMGGQNNPYLDSMVQKSLGSVMSAAGTAGVRSGSFGNSGIQEQALNNMSTQANNMYGQQYQFDQGQRMQAIGMAPQFANQAYQDASQLMNAGGLQQQQAQNNLDFGYSQFQEAQNNPYKQIAATGNVVNSGMGQTTTSNGGGK